MYILSQDDQKMTIEDPNQYGSYYEGGIDTYNIPYSPHCKIYEIERLYIIIGCLIVTLLGVLVMIAGIGGMI